MAALMTDTEGQAALHDRQVPGGQWQGWGGDMAEFLACTASCAVTVCVRVCACAYVCALPVC